MTTTTTWVVVAHQTGARFMEHRPGYGHHLLQVAELQNPDGRKRNRELESDRAGESGSGSRGAGGRRGLKHEQTAHQHVVETFVHEIADELKKARATGMFGQLILVAEPKLLGLLRDALDSATAQKVVSSVTKDLAAVPPRGIAQHIADVLPL